MRLPSMFKEAATVLAYCAILPNGSRGGDDCWVVALAIHHASVVRTPHPWE
jgi:hypothetical protein